MLDRVLSEVFFIYLESEPSEESELNEEAIVSIFKAITNFQLSLSTRCHRDYEDTIAWIIRDQLEVIFIKMLHAKEDDALRRAASMLSWGLYGASVDWKRTSDTISPEEFIKPVIPHLMNSSVKTNIPCENSVSSLTWDVFYNPT